MNTRRHHLAAVALLVTALPGLSGCLPAVVAAGAGGGYAVHDRRSLGAQIDDQTLAFRIEGNINEVIVVQFPWDNLLEVKVKNDTIPDYVSMVE